MAKKLTPMQEQYEQFKSEYPDALLLFRLGDFYEVFGDDAVTAARVLGITLTSRSKKDKESNPMAGIPYHALPNYLPKLINAGIKVAIADQVEDAVPGKLVKRAITKIITAGTITEDKSLDESKNNFIACVYLENQKNNHIFHLAFTDLTTGTFKGFSTTNPITLKNEINKLKPSETLVNEKQKETFEKIIDGYKQNLDPAEFDFNQAKASLENQLNVKTLAGYGIDDDDQIIIPAGVLLSYLKDTQKTDLKHITRFDLYRYSDYMQLDDATIRNLELLYPMHSDGNMAATVYGVLNECKSPMGKRLLRQYIVNPLVNKDMLEDRLDAVSFFFNDPVINNDVRDLLNEVYDIERIVGKLGLSSANPKDIVALKDSLVQIYKVREELIDKELPKRMQFILNDLDVEKLESITQEIHKTIKQDPPVSITEARIFTDGYNQSIDELRDIRNNSKQILAEIQQREVDATGIPSLKISFNKVFGYYIEVTKTHLDKVPESYIRKQTLANAERYITDELKTVEEKILTSEDRLIELERDLFIEFRESLIEHLEFLKNASERIAEIDVIANFAHIARQFRYIKPIIKDDENYLDLEIGRHPVVERIVDEFIPNNTEFNKKSLIHILTGPNMSGKSTYIRQVALISLIAQIGCYVPADKFEFSMFDRIFTRVGASDNLSKGESTFMVEMSETANILNNATEHSLVILDEVGRGTSTYDGVAIAWSIIEHIHDKIGARTLFATHYHELVELEDSFEGICNFNVAVENEKDEITFTHRIISGGTNQSYGVHVASLAGVPKEVVKRADEILQKFEGQQSAESKSTKDSKSSSSKTKKARKQPAKPKNIHPGQLGLM